MYPPKAHNKIANSFNNKKWDLVWMVNGSVKEVIERNKPKSLLSFKKRQLETSTHKMGKLSYLETGTHKY